MVEMQSVLPAVSSLPTAGLLVLVAISQGFLVESTALMALQILLKQRCQILLLALSPWLCYEHLVAVIISVTVLTLVQLAQHSRPEGPETWQGSEGSQETS